MLGQWLWGPNPHSGLWDDCESYRALHRTGEAALPLVVSWAHAERVWLVSWVSVNSPVPGNTPASPPPPAPPRSSEGQKKQFSVLAVRVLQGQNDPVARSGRETALKSQPSPRGTHRASRKQKRIMPRSPGVGPTVSSTSWSSIVEALRSVSDDAGQGTSLWRAVTIPETVLGASNTLSIYLSRYVDRRLPISPNPSIRRKCKNFRAPRWCLNRENEWRRET